MSTNERTRERILVVDDDRLVLYTVSQALTKEGFDVVSADDAEEALRVCTHAPLAVALLDVRLPGMSGLDAAARMRDRGVPVIFLTAYSDAATVARGVAEGALGYLVKPLEVNQIIPMVRAAIARGRDLATRAAEEQKLIGALTRARSVSVAVGLTMARYGLDEQSAFGVLRAAARDQRSKLHELAAHVSRTQDCACLAPWVAGGNVE